MGDAIFTPFYEVLKRRGVKFAFFHKVDELVPNAAGDAVDTIRIMRQADLAAGVAAYDPLVDVKGLPSWPNAPRYAQLDPAQARQLQDAGINLESHWTDWPERERSMAAGRSSWRHVSANAVASSRQPALSKSAARKKHASSRSIG